MAVAAQGATCNFVLLLGDSAGHMTPVNIHPGAGSDKIIAGDFNHDSLPDVITLNTYNPGFISVFQGDGNGGFSLVDSTPVTSNFGQNFTGGDFNNDGNVDLVLLRAYNGYPNVLSMLSSDSSGAFPGGEVIIDSLPLGSYPDVVAADLNADNKTDLIVSNGQYVYFYAGHGNNTFAQRVGFLAAPNFSEATGLFISDFNGDHKPDIAVGNISTVTILTGDGTGNFTALPAIANIAGNKLTAADFNGDSIVDVIAAGTWAPGMMNGDGTGNFSTPYAVYIPSSQYTNITKGDFNNDGYMDFATTNGYQVVVFINSFPNDTPVTITITGHNVTCNGLANGSATIAATGGVAPFSYFWYIANQTNHYGGLQPSTVTGYITGGNGCIAKATTTITEPAPLTVDITGELPCGSAATLTAHPAGGTEPYTYTWFNIAPAQHTQTATILTAGNYKVKVIDANGCNINSALVYMPIEPRFTTADLYDTPTSPDAIATADFNNDGIKDLVTATTGSKGVTLLIGHAGGHLTVANSFPISNVAAMAPAIAAADFNIDGNQDIMLASQMGDTLYFIAGNGNGSFNLPVTLNGGGTGYSKTMLTTDIDRDGKMDLVLSGADNPSASLVILMNNGNATFTNRSITEVNPHFGHVVSADFNNDNLTDLISLDPYHDSLSVFLGYGNGYFHGAIRVAVLSFPNMVTSGDFNHDNNMDIVITSLYSSACGVFLGDGTGHFTLKSSFGNSNVRGIATEDFDGDLNLDLALAVPNGVLVRLGSDTGSFSQPVALAYGVITPQALVTADFNYDGQPDIATPNGSQDKTSVMFDCVIYSGLHDSKPEQNFELYPNPATNTVTITVDESMIGSTATITDVTGRKVAAVQLNIQHSQLNITNFPSGLYFICIGNSTRKLIIEK